MQTVGVMKKDIDSRAIRDTEQQHLRQFMQFCDQLQAVHPEALCLGAGGCRICSSCAYPEPCRFPSRAHASMEGYGLFVTQVCRDHQIPYHYGSRTITYTSCVLFHPL